MDAARDVAEELGTTINDAVVRLAEEGMMAGERRRRAQALSDARRDAVAQRTLEDATSFPTAEELHEAMLSGRRAP